MMRPDPAIVWTGVAAMFTAATTDAMTMDQILHTWSIVGAFGGALISTLMNDRDSRWKRVSKFIASLFAGFLFSPAIILSRGIDINPHMVMAVAAVVAFASWGILQVIMHQAPVLFKRYVEGFFEKMAQAKGYVKPDESE